MNILYISNLYGNPWGGPTYSVPAQIKAQSEVDNVFWYNLSKSKQEKWKDYSFYHDITEYPNGDMKSLPVPFNHPDIIVVEQFYKLAKKAIRNEIINSGIPYVIIPRGELTAKAQMRKSLKKKLANLIYMEKFANRATAIQFLTDQELETTQKKWFRNSLVIPNGINMPQLSKVSFSENEVRCVYIGRIEPYQKGLDMLLEACSGIKEELTSSNCQIVICGPDREGALHILEEMVSKYALESIVSFHDAVFGIQKEEMLLNSDVFIQTSRFEGHPMGVIEALSYGLPCVVTQGTNMCEQIKEASAGWEAQNSVHSIKTAILKMLASYKEIGSYSFNAKQLALKYDWRVIALATHDDYLKLISN